MVLPNAVKILCTQCNSYNSDEDLIKGQCAICGQVLRDAQDLYDFREEGSDYYFADLPRNEVANFLDIQQENGWQEAISFVRKRFGAELVNVMLDYRRASWVYLTHPSAFEYALELGCGWGASLPILASQFNHVFALDLTQERVQFAKNRCLEMGIDNITFGMGTDKLPLPFPPESFDLVSLNGVLAYVSENQSTNPRLAQLGLLRDIHRIMRPGASLYIGSQNRFGWPYLGGGKDHLGLRWTSVMPRWLSNIYCKVRTGYGYRTLTYTAGGYAKLLKEAGFDTVEVSWPHHNHTSFAFNAPLNREGIRLGLINIAKSDSGTSVKTKLARLTNFLGLFKFIVPSYCIVARK